MAGPAAAPALAQTNFDRPGADYLRMPLRSGDPADCAMACERDRRCRAWSFSYPSERLEMAVCWLKNAVAPRIANPCCVSGVRGAGVIERRTGPVEHSTDRAGGDYRGFEIKKDERANADQICRHACDADSKCRAWTYARPGYVGKAARCFLKKEIKPPRRRPGFTSGVVR
ncbi:PAN domain-containing protein [Nitrobacter sp. NHB1]